MAEHRRCRAIRPEPVPWNRSELARFRGQGGPWRWDCGRRGQPGLPGADVRAGSEPPLLQCRPYRPARKLEEALLEISSKKGILYDPEAADACRRMLVEKGFTFRFAADDGEPN